MTPVNSKQMPMNSTRVPSIALLLILAASVLGYLFGYVSVAALIVGFFARRAAKVRPIWKIIALYLLALIVLLGVLLAGKVKPSA